jgi:hypothetical protein
VRVVLAKARTVPSTTPTSPEARVIVLRRTRPIWVVVVTNASEGAGVLMIAENARPFSARKEKSFDKAMV